METARNRIRRSFAPLNVSVAIACDSAYSPLMQAYKAATQEYEPNRLLSPTVIRPIITASAPDGSWPVASANASLANLKWYVNGVDISTLSDWVGKYTIATAGSTRGSITITKNIAPGNNITMRFEANLVDSRLGVTIPIKTDEVVLSTVDVAEDSYSISLSEDKNLRYNPLWDKLHLYDYKVAHGIISASASEEAAAKDGNEYKRVIAFNVYQGGTKLTSGFTVKFYKVNSASSITEVTSSDYEVLSISTSQIELDLRLITKADYMIKAFISNTEIAKLQFSINRVWADFSCRPSNETSILPDQTERYDEAQVDSEGKKIEYPGNVIKITWYTDTAEKTAVQHNEGGTTVFQLEKTGIGKDYSNDWIDVYIEAQQKEAHSVAIDESSNVLTDESGNILIFN